MGHEPHHKVNSYAGSPRNKSSRCPFAAPLKAFGPSTNRMGGLGLADTEPLDGRTSDNHGWTLPRRRPSSPMHLVLFAAREVRTGAVAVWLRSAAFTPVAVTRWPFGSFEEPSLWPNKSSDDTEALQSDRVGTVCEGPGTPPRNGQRPPTPGDECTDAEAEAESELSGDHVADEGGNDQEDEHGSVDDEVSDQDCSSG
jgi:hypothetical protein